MSWNKITDPRVLEARALVLHSRTRVRSLQDQVARLKFELQVARMTIRGFEAREAEMEQMLLNHDPNWRELLKERK
jgi:hypothetical protein